MFESFFWSVTEEMLSSPHKPVNNEVMLRGITRSNSDDSDDSDDLPSLIACSDVDEDSDEDDAKKTHSKTKDKGKETVMTKPKTNGECVDKWYKLSSADKDKNIHVMKINLLSPFLFGQVDQDDKWINWAFECGLLPSKSSFDIRDLKEEFLDAVDLVESAFTKLAESVLWKNKDGLLKTLETITKIKMSQHLDKAITCAESFLSFTSVRDILRLKSGMNKKQGDIALLFAQNQVSDHIKRLAAGENIVEDFGRRCRDEEDQSAENKKKGNDDFSNGRYAAAISKYTLALHVSPYNHVLYGNRAQSFLKTNEYGHALADGRRATVLKADWHKAQYRYAQAYFELGFYDKAKEVNRAARKICSEKKDLDSQYDKFIKSIQTASNSRGKTTGKRTSQTVAVGRKSSIGSDTEDLPELVDAESSDTSKSDDGRLGEDKMPGLVELESQEETDDSRNSDGESAPQQQSESSYESDSDDSTSRRRSRRTVAYLEHRKKRQDKARKYLHERQEKEMKKKNSELTTKIKEQKKVGKRGRNNQVTQKELSVELQRKRELNDWLTQGTKAIQEKKSVTAVHSYGEALKMIDQYSYQLLEMKEIDFVILLYSHGTACLHTGTHEELQVAMKQFQIIILQYRHIDFPLAYHGEGSVLYKQNRFTDALIALEKGLQLVKKLGDDLGTYRWPASQVIIDESKPGKLLSTFEVLIRICKHPPRPDAICRYSDCTSKTQIYLTDPDYKGFIRLICHENCKIEFHPLCWKKLKNSDSGKAGDKDFIEDECMTPDCCGSVTNIQIFDAEGLKTEFNSEKTNPKLEAKSKPAKQAKVKLSGASAKEKRKKKGKEVLKVDQPVAAEVTATDNNEEKQQGADHLQVNNTPFSTVHREEKPSGGENMLPEMHRGYDPFSSDVGIPPADDGVYILKKESDEDPAKGSVVKGFSKAKSKKKKIKNTQTLDEFLKDHGGRPLRSTIDSIDDMDEIPPPKCTFDLVTPPPGWSQHEMEAPFAIPPHLQDEAADFEASYRAMNMFPSSSSSCSFSLSERCDVKNVTDYVSTLLLEILREEGALDLADPKILQPLSILADECQEIISQAGGLRPILEQSGKFVFHGNKVMLPEEKEFIQDVLQALKPFSKGSSKETKNPFLQRTINGLETDTVMDHSVKLQKDISNTGIASESIWDIDGLCKTNGADIGGSQLASCSSSSPLLYKPSISPRFNPDAKEFVPIVQQQTLSNTLSNTSITPVMDIESVDDQIVEQVSNVQPASDKQNRYDLSLVTGVNHNIEPAVTGPTCKSETSLALGSRANGNSSETLSNVHEQLTSFVSGEKNAKDDLMQAQNLQKPNSGGEQVTNSKTKAVQTQPNVKTKGVGTDPIPEPFKAEYHRAVAEKDALQNKLQEATDRHAAMRNKNTVECDKLKKKLAEALQEKEKYLKDVLDIKQKNLEEINKLRQQCEDKDEKIKTLNQKLHDAEEKSSTVGSLKKEVMSYKAQVSVEKESWMKERSEKDDLLKNIKLQHQHQQFRAQEAEVKLLELRRDVGLRFLERAYQESHITINNLIQARNARIAGPKFDELLNTWKSYASECHQRVLQCKTTFNDQIELLKGGCTLASVPQLPIPGPPPYPAIPVLQSLVPGQQPQSHPSKESSANSRTSAAATATVVAAAAAAAAVPAATAAVSSAGAPSMVMPPGGSNVSLNGESVPGSGSAAAADKGRPSNSFERIMLRLSAMYPTFSRLELTGFIKEVRHNKHGSLTGLSLEDIFASVSELVEQKKKAGLLRSNSTATQRSAALTYKQTAAQPQNQQTYGVKAQTEALKMCLGHYEEDLCVICHEDMNTSTDIVTLDCTHRYHSACIRKWLLGEQSTCPTCREHALLPDEFPRLK